MTKYKKRHLNVIYGCMLLPIGLGAIALLSLFIHPVVVPIKIIPTPTPTQEPINFIYFDQSNNKNSIILLDAIYKKTKEIFSENNLQNTYSFEIMKNDKIALLSSKVSQEINVDSGGISHLAADSLRAFPSPNGKYILYVSNKPWKSDLPLSLYNRKKKTHEEVTISDPTLTVPSVLAWTADATNVFITDTPATLSAYLRIYQLNTQNLTIKTYSKDKIIGPIYSLFIAPKQQSFYFITNKGLFKQDFLSDIATQSGIATVSAQKITDMAFPASSQSASLLYTDGKNVFQNDFISDKEVLIASSSGTIRHIIWNDNLILFTEQVVTTGSTSAYMVQGNLLNTTKGTSMKFAEHQSDSLLKAGDIVPLTFYPFN